MTKKRNLILGATLLLGICVHAEVLLVEDFDYAIGAKLTQCGSWYLQWQGGDDRLTITNGLEYTGYIQSGQGNGLLIDAESSSAIPHIQLPAPVTSGSVYVAMMIQATLPVGKSGWLTSFRDNKITSSDYNENGRLLISSDNRLGISVAKPTGTNGYSSKVLDTQKVYVVVLKYAIQTGANNDKVSLFVLDSLCRTEPATPDVGPLSDNEVPDINPANFLVRGFDDEGWIVLDGIRIATTWHEALGVTPTGITDIKSGTGKTDVRKYIENGTLVVESQGIRRNVLGTAVDM